MHKIFVEYRQLEEELVNPKTAFMRATLHEMKIDIDEDELYNNYTDYTPEEVDDLIDGDKECWQLRYFLTERAFCKSQYLKKPIKCKRRRKIPLLPPNVFESANEYESDTELSGYEPDTDEEPSNTQDKLITKQLERAISQSKNSVYVKLGRKTLQNRLKYLAYRIKLRALEILNARQFLMQAEIMISKRSERYKRQLEELRKAYRVHKKRLDYKNLLFAFAYADNVDYADAEKFEKILKYESEYF